MEDDKHGKYPWEKKEPTKTGIELWKRFQEWWPPWVEHVDCWKEKTNNSIAVVMKDDDYQTSGMVYIFTKKSEDQHTLKSYVRSEFKSVENIANNEGTRT